ncbi:hypothetical protein C8Q80DRAFT_507067 [Daedaleopsis nitida]|nr:hypothetical protein C8Q80DRAFT_507067 [Daedaleopsis nitida]
MAGDSTTSSRDRDPTAEAVSALLQTMQHTLGSLGKTFDLMGHQTMCVASLGPAVDAVFQITAVRGELDDQNQREQIRMQEVKIALQDKVKCHLRETLRSRVTQIVADIVRTAVADRVKHELTARIPSSLREDITEYKRRNLEVKTNLINSEARRHNALIRASGLEEPLQPLLRPLGIPRTENLSGTHASTTPTRPSAGHDRGRGRGRGSTSDHATTRLSIKTEARSVRTSSGMEDQPARIGTNAGGLASGVPWDIEATTPSPLFPRDMMALVSLRPDEANALVRDYGLASGEGDEAIDKHVRHRGGPQGSRPNDTSGTNVGDSGHGWTDAGLQSTREDDINRFMRFIGVGFEVLPTPPRSTSKSRPEIITSPLVERPDYAFSR